MSTLFGPDAAIRDTHLEEYLVERTALQRNRPIITGRWGTGKSAALLNEHNTLRKALLDKDPSAEYLWYIHESSLNPHILIETIKSTPNTADITFKLRSIWKAEIYRRCALILATLLDEYRNVSGPHWQFIARVHPRHRTSLWESLTETLFHISAPVATGTPLEEKTGSVPDFLDPAVHEAVERCMLDVRSHHLRPRIGIEPIDTPASHLEAESGIASQVVLALLNTFQSSFVSGPDKHIPLLLAIPWHRFDRHKLDQPQHLLDQFTSLDWEASDLKLLINKRIEWEFDRVRRRSRGSDPWNVLVDPTYRNHDYRPAILEDSFRYVLRNTHHRPRDVLQVLRRACEIFAFDQHITTDDLLRGNRGLRIPGRHLKQAVVEVNSERAKDRVSEGSRQFPDLHALCRALHLMPTPFTHDDLATRLTGIAPSGITLDYAINALWESGVIGASLPYSPSVGPQLRLNDAYRVEYQTAGAHPTKYRRYFLLHYNYTDRITDLLAASRHSQLRCDLFIHPVFDSMLFRLDSNIHPWGV